MPTTFQKIKEIVANPEIRIRAALDSEVRFHLNIELAAIVTQWIGLYLSSVPLIIIGTFGFWYGIVGYVKNILRVYDEWKAEKEKEEKSSSDDNKNKTEES